MRTAVEVVLFVSLMLDLVMTAFAVTRQDKSRSIYFAALTAALFFYTFGYLLEIMSGTPEAAMTALRMENLGIPLIAPFFMLTMLSMFYNRLVRRWMLPAALVFGLGIFVCVLTNDWHHLHYTGIELVQAGGMYFARLGHGPSYFINQAVTFLLMPVTCVILVRRFIMSGPQGRRQMAPAIFGAAIGLMGNIINITGILPYSLDPTPFTLTIALGLVSINIFRYRIMDIVTLSSGIAVGKMDDAMIVLDRDWCYLYSNESAKHLFPSLGYIHENDSIFQMPQWPPQLAAREIGQATFARQDPISGETLTYRANTSSIAGDDGRQIGWSVVMRDITDMTALMERLEELATLDELTGLYNRRQFLTETGIKMRLAARENMSVGWIMFDIDFFKKVNDTYGHAAGDHVLRAVADTVKHQLRPYDVLARYGGEEFVICTVCRDGQCVLKFASRLREAVQDAEIVFDGKSVAITASFGVALSAPSVAADEAIRAADEAMYRAKEGGRNRVETAPFVFWDETNRANIRQPVN